MVKFNQYINITSVSITESAMSGIRTIGSGVTLEEFVRHGVIFKDIKLTFIIYEIY
jgi:hypothetical protein